MRDLLRLEEIDRRIEWLVRTTIMTRDKDLAPEAERLLRAVFREGLVPRGRIPEIVGLAERTARRRVTAPLERLNLLTSETPKGPVALGMPGEALRFSFRRCSIHPLLGRNTASRELSDSDGIRINF
jgi:hypothetical protein